MYLIRILMVVIACNFAGTALPMKRVDKTKCISKEVWKAIKNGNVEQVKEFIKNGSLNKNNINDTTSYGETPLHWSCGRNNFEMTELLLDVEGINIEAVNNTLCCTPFHHACEKGYLNIAKLLWEKGAKIGRKFNYTALHHACKTKQEDTVKWLLALPEVDINNQDFLGMTPLHYARDYFDIEQLLLENNANLNIKGGYGYTPYHYKNIKSKIDLDRVIEFGANYTLKDKDDETFLDECPSYLKKEVSYYQNISDLNDKALLIFDKDQKFDLKMRKDILRHLIVTGYGNPGKNNDLRSMKELVKVYKLFVNNGKKKELHSLLKNDEDTITYRGRLKYLDEKFDTQENLGKDWHHISNLTFNYL